MCLLLGMLIDVRKENNFISLETSCRCGTCLSKQLHMLSTVHADCFKLTGTTVWV